MNALSWLLYLADVLGGLTVVFGVAAAGLAIYCAGSALVFVAEDLSSDFPRFWTIWWRAAISCFVLVVLAVALPSKQTLYAVAISEVGERVVMSESVQGMANDATKALHQWIKRQIEPEAKASK
jgi:hypothetical protein